MSGKTYHIPCKIGDTVWTIRNYKGQLAPKQGKVSEIWFGPDMELCMAVRHIGRGRWGQNIFLTEADALKEIERRQGA